MADEQNRFEELLTYREAANVLGISDRSIWALVDRGDLPAVRFGRSVRVDPADLRRFIDSSKTQAREKLAHSKK